MRKEEADIELAVVVAVGARVTIIGGILAFDMFSPPYVYLQMCFLLFVTTAGVLSVLFPRERSGELPQLFYTSVEEMQLVIGLLSRSLLPSHFTAGHMRTRGLMVGW